MFAFLRDEAMGWSILRKGGVSRSLWFLCFLRCGGSRIFMCLIRTSEIEASTVHEKNCIFRLSRWLATSSA